MVEKGSLRWLVHSGLAENIEVTDMSRSIKSVSVQEIGLEQRHFSKERAARPPRLQPVTTRSGVNSVQFAFAPRYHGDACPGSPLLASKPCVDLRICRHWLPQHPARVFQRMKRSLFAELKRRNVFRAAILYIGAVWALAQGITQLTPVVGAPEWTARWFLVAAIIAFPFWIAFAWFFEFTPEGLKLERDVAPEDSITHHTGRKLDFAIIGVLAVAVVLLLTDRFVLRHGVNAETIMDGRPTASIPEIESDPSIAVLPMVNMSDDKGNEYFSDGMSEELLNLLAKVPGVRVIARTSSFAFKGKDKSIQDIARALQVAAVLEGSVRKSGDKIRITVQLIRSKDSSHLWSETYDRTLDDIFKVQDEIAAAVVGQLRIKLLGELPTAKPVDPKAYPLILQAQALADQGTKEGRVQAIALIQQALTIAPNETRAWAQLARNYLNQAIFGERPATEGSQLAKEAANKAVELDPDNATAHATLGRIASDFDFDLPLAAQHYQHAFAVEPGSLTAVNSAAILLGNIGRMDEALELFEYRAARDPANPAAHANLGITLYQAKRWDSALDSLRSAVRLSPSLTVAHYQIGTVLLLGKHDAAGALEEFSAEPEGRARMAGLPLALHGLGRAKEADAALAALIDKYSNDAPVWIAAVCAYRGEADDAFTWLDRGAAIHDPSLSLVLVEPLLDSLHDDPRWLPLLRKAGYAPEQIARIKLAVTLPVSGHPSSQASTVPH
jgi:TolB-like protein/Tfp pilus assembly protein PilF